MSVTAIVTGSLGLSGTVDVTNFPTGEGGALMVTTSGSLPVTFPSSVQVTSTGSLGVAVQNQVTVTSTGSLPVSFIGGVTVTSTGSLDVAPKNALPQAPVSGTCFGFQFVSGTVTQATFLDAEHLNLVAAISASKVFICKTDVDCAYRFSSFVSGVNIDELAITGSVQADRLFSKERSDDVVPIGASSIVIKGISTTLTGTFTMRAS